MPKPIADLDIVQAPIVLARLTAYMVEDLGIALPDEVPDEVDASAEATIARCDLVEAILKKARRFYFDAVREEARKRARPFEVVAAEAADKHGVPFTLVTSEPECSCEAAPSDRHFADPEAHERRCRWRLWALTHRPVSVGEDLRVPPALQQVADLQPVRDLVEAFGAAVGDLDLSLADLPAKGPGEEVPS